MEITCKSCGAILDSDADKCKACGYEYCEYCAPSGMCPDCGEPEVAPALKGE